MSKEIQLTRILSGVSSLGLRQLGVEDAKDSDLDFFMWGGKAADGTSYKFLGKDRKARVSSLQITDFSTVGILLNTATGVISSGLTLPNGVTATTQIAGDSTKKVATTKFVADALDIENLLDRVGSDLVPHNIGESFATKSNIGKYKSGLNSEFSFGYNGNNAVFDSTLPFLFKNSNVKIEKKLEILDFTDIGIVQNNASGVLSTSLTLPDGTLATTQSAGDNTKKLATTEFVTTAVGDGGQFDRVGTNLQPKTLGDSIRLKHGTAKYKMGLNDEGTMWHDPSAMRFRTGTTAPLSGFDFAHKTSHTYMTLDTLGVDKETAFHFLNKGSLQWVYWRDSANNFNLWRYTNGVDGYTVVKYNTNGDIDFAKNVKIGEGLTIEDFTSIGIVQNNASGVLSSSLTLPNGTIGTTQTAGDSSTKIATTKYVDDAVSGFWSRSSNTLTPKTITDSLSLPSNSSKILLGATGQSQMFQDANKLNFNLSHNGDYFNFTHSTGLVSMALNTTVVGKGSIFTFADVGVSKWAFWNDSANDFGLLNYANSEYAFKINSDGDMELPRSLTVGSGVANESIDIKGLNGAFLKFYNGTVLKGKIAGETAGLDYLSLLHNFDGNVNMEDDLTVEGDLGVGMTTTNHASAIGQFDSTTQGVLLPQMTNAQMLAISSPAEGLEVWNSTYHKKFRFNSVFWLTDGLHGCSGSSALVEGDVVVMETNGTNYVALTTTAQDEDVVGVVVNVVGTDISVAISGQWLVRVKGSSTTLNGGDYVASSATSQHAEKPANKNGTFARYIDNLYSGASALKWCLIGNFTHKA